MGERGPVIGRSLVVGVLFCAGGLAGTQSVIRHRPQAPQIQRPLIRLAPQVQGDYVDGYVSSAWACEPGKSCERFFYLSTNTPFSKRIMLPSDLSGPWLELSDAVGRYIRIEGTWDSGGRFTAKFGKFLLDPRAKPRMGALMATQPAAVRPFLNVPVRFADHPGVTPNQPQFFQDAMGNASPKIGHFYASQSYGLMKLDGSATTPWIDLPHPASYYVDPNVPPGSPNPVDIEKLILDINSIIRPNFLIEDFWGVNVLFNWPFAGNNGGGGAFRPYIEGLGGSLRVTVNNPDSGGAGFGNILTLLAHEMGHETGFDHSAGPYSTSYDSRWDLMSSGHNWLPGDGAFGAIPVSTNAYHRFEVGWIPKNRMFFGLPGTSQTIRLERLTNPTVNGYLAAIVFMGGDHYYTVEARRNVGPYDVLDTNSGNVGGLPGEAVVIHEVQMGRTVTDEFTGTPYNDRFSRVVDLDGDGDPNDAGEAGSPLNAQWKVGETFNDATHGIQIKVDGIGATFYNVTITVNASRPWPNQVTKTGDSGDGSLRSALYYAGRFKGLPGAGAVDFKIPIADPGYAGGVFRIRPTKQLWMSGSGVTVDGNTQTLFTGDTNAQGPEIVLDGSQIPTDQWVPGLIIQGSSNTIRNLVIKSFPAQGILVDGFLGATKNTIENCYIGTNHAANQPGGNKYDGVVLYNLTTANIVRNNVISGNLGSGIALMNSSGNTILGNKVGTNFGGGGPIPNGDRGIWVGTRASNNLIKNNTVSGNTHDGILIYGPDTNDNKIVGNKVGTNSAGTAPVPNGAQGILVYNGPDRTIIGGDTALLANVASGNTYPGIAIIGTSTEGNVVLGNLVGTAANGKSAIPNGSGVYLGGGAKNNFVGGTTPGARNIVSGNTDNGVIIADTGTTGNVVIGNYIGINRAGTAAQPNGNGVAVLNGASANRIGGSAAGERNIISGNNGGGIWVWAAAVSNRFVGNYIGTSPDGTSAIPNLSAGIGITDGSSANEVGGIVAGERNIISGNGAQGVVLVDPGTTNNIIRGNWIGLNVNGKALGNAYDGVALATWASGNLVGGFAPEWGNQIAFNKANGIYVGDPTTSGNRIRMNRIWSNQWLGIDLNGNQGNYGVTPNDAGDADTGPNGLQNFPLLSLASRSSGLLAVNGSITARPNRSYAIDIFTTSAAEPSGYGEGQYFVATVTVVTNASGVATFSLNNLASASGKYATATATDTVTKETSEFSAAISVQ